MKVSLIDYTGSGHADPAAYAAAQLIFAKSTRLTMSPGLLQEVQAHAQDQEWRDHELAYIANTIPASWEMVGYTFMVEGVTRAFTHQFVRSRQFSFAQQTMRVLDVSEGNGWDYLTGPTIGEKGPHSKLIYTHIMNQIAQAYKDLIADGVAVEDARGVLPTNILTNIVARCNMRTFVELVRKRTSPRVQGEYRSVLEEMKARVREVHPWIDLFIDRTFEQAAVELDAEIAALPDKDQRVRMMKLVDLMRGQS